MAADDEDAAVDALSIFIDVLESAAPILGRALPQLAEWCAQIGATPSQDLRVRETALQVGILLIK